MDKDERLEQQRQAARKHGIFAFRDRGPEALDATNVSSLQELRELVSTQPGRMELRRELTARIALMCYLAFGEMTKVAGDKDASIFDAGVTKHAATWFKEMRRLLDSWPVEELENANVLEALRDGDDD